MYYHGMDENVIMAEEFGAYETFSGSPASKGLFQFDLWNIEKLEKKLVERDASLSFSYNDLLNMASMIILSPDHMSLDGQSIGGQYENMSQSDLDILTTRIIKQLKDVVGKVVDTEFNWNDLRLRMIKNGLYFSLLFSQMPTASSAQILGCNESTECYTQFLYARTVLSGQFIIVVDHLVKDLEDINLWNTTMLKHLLASQGSIQEFSTVGMDDHQLIRFEFLKKKYRTAFEISQKTLANLYIDRAKYQCQSTSHNVFMKSPTVTSLNAYHFHMWAGGAKTGMYYLRQMVKSLPLNFSLDSITTGSKKVEDDDIECLVCQS